MAADANVTAGLRRMGVSEEDIEAMLAQQLQQQAEAGRQAGIAEEFGIYEENWESWQFYLVVQTQWLYRGMNGRRSGLNYAGVESGIRMAGLARAKWPALLADLRNMELAVLEADNELADAASS